MELRQIDAKEAKRLANIERSLIEKFRASEKEQRHTTAPDKGRESTQPPEPLQTLQPIPPLTVSTAKKLEKMQQRLQEEFANMHHRELEEVRENEKKFEPITRAIREHNEIVKSENKSKALVRQNRLKQIEKFRPRTFSTPSIERGRTDVVDDSDQEVFRPNDSLRQLVDTNMITLGSTGVRYFPRANDSKFGIWYDEKIEKPKIGSEEITFDYDDIVLVKIGKKYKGTEGLWKLLTNRGALKKDIDFTADDWIAYKDILVQTNSLYQRNDPSTNRPKSSSGKKWKTMIRFIWDEILRERENNLNAENVDGSGLKLYNERPVEYRYINNLQELVNRLQFIHAQEIAGNNNFHNEKLAVVQFLYDRLEELVKTHKGVKYLIRCLSALPEHAIEGSGLLNNIINKLPFELHAPRNWNFDTYNYCGPGTKLDERLARSDKGINPLDEACKQHDIWYRDHKNTEDRWEADKVLQKKAWDRVISGDADINERLVGLATTGGMWLKRKLGMGLGTSGCVYPVTQSSQFNPL